jgi:hypothetical protein
MPVERPTQVHPIISMKTGKAVGEAVRQSVLLRAEVVNR